MTMALSTQCFRNGQRAKPIAITGFMAGQIFPVQRHDALDLVQQKSPQLASKSAVGLAAITSSSEAPSSIRAAMRSRMMDSVST